MDDCDKEVPNAIAVADTDSESSDLKRTFPSTIEDASDDLETKKTKSITEALDPDDASNDPSTSEEEQAIVAQSPPSNVEELALMLGLVSDIENFRRMTRAEMIQLLDDARVGKLSFEIPDATETIQDLICNHHYDAEETPPQGQVHSGQVTYFDMLCELRSYYSNHPDRGYLLAELRPKEMGRSFVWDGFPEAIRSGIQEGMVMKIDDVEAFMGEEGSDTEVRAVATMTFEAVVDFFSFLPNIKEAMGSLKGSVSLGGEMGLSNGTFLDVGRTSSVLISAEVKDTEIPVSGQDLILRDPSFSLQFSNFTELSEDQDKYVSRRIMALLVRAKAKWLMDDGDMGKVATLNFHCSLSDSRQKPSSASFYADAEEFKLPFGDIFCKDFRIRIESFSPLILEVSTSLRFGQAESNEIRLHGKWSKGSGFDLSSTLDEDEIHDFSIADLIDFHSTATHSSESLSKLPDPMLQNEGTVFKRSMFRYKSTPHLLEVSNEKNIIKGVVGLTMEADLVCIEADTSSRVLLSISKEGGIAVADMLS